MESVMRTIKTSAVTEHAVFQDSTYRSLHAGVDENARLDRQTFWITAAILAVMVPSGAYGVYCWISTLPV